MVGCRSRLLWWGNVEGVHRIAGEICWQEAAGLWCCVYAVCTWLAAPVQLHQLRYMRGLCLSQAL